MGMSIEQYREKLRGFNSTEKYKAELKVLASLLKVKFGETILDYGCGIGSAINYLNEITSGYFLGYDVVNYNEGKNDFVMNAGRSQERWFCKHIPFGINKAYFMHSFAHIPHIEDVLIDLRSKGAERIVVVTPNLNWLEKMRNDKYVPDPTVIRHYTMESLCKTLEDAGYSVQVGEIGASCEGHKERIIAVATIV